MASTLHLRRAACAMALLGVGAWSGVPGGSSASLPTDSSPWHPLEPGTVWEYEVTEEGEIKQQLIELEARDDGKSWILASRTGSRRAYYEISVGADCFFLHKVRYKLSYLPFAKSTRFEPPMPFLHAVPSDSTSWSWRGRATGMGRTLRAAEYHARVVGQETAGPSRWYPGDLVVEATFEEDDGALHGQRAAYRPGIGLIGVETAAYSKRLVRWKSAADAPWQVMAGE